MSDHDPLLHSGHGRLVAYDGRGDVLPACLSASPDKRILFGADPYFLEGWEDLGLAVRNPTAFLFDHALLLLKAEAVIERKLDAAVEWCRERGFIPSSAALTKLTPHITRALWRYQWNIATRDRRDLADRLFEMAPALVLILRRDRKGPVPASVELSELKGPADPRQRLPEHLRYRLGNKNYLLNYAHTADEPSDVVYEMAVLLPRSERMRVWRETDQRLAMNPSLTRLVEDAYATAPTGDFDLSAALANIRRRLDPRHDAAAYRLLDALTSGKSQDWRALLRYFEEAEELDPLTIVTLGTHFMKPSIPGRTQVLPGIDPSEWVAPTSWRAASS